MGAASHSMKTMGLYQQVERIHNELRALGFEDGAPLRVEDLVPFDQYHYEGTATVDQALRRLGVTVDSHVLDVGSGIGGPARYMAARAGCRVTALELQPDLNATAVGLTERCGLAGRVEHLCGDMLSGIVAGRGFDALVSMLCFLHIPDRATLLRQCHAALRPGAAMFVDDYYARGSLTEAEHRDLADKVCCPYVPSLAELEAQLHTAGFGEIELLDQSEPWTAFVEDRLTAFRGDRTRLVALHGAQLVEALDDFYTTVVGLFTGGRLGGVRFVARRDSTNDH